MITAIILDLDDTLFMTQATACEMECAAAVAVGLPPVDPAIHRRTWGMGIAEALPLRLLGVDPSHYPAFIAAHADQIKRYVAEDKLDQLSQANVAALGQLQSAGYQLYALTSRHHGEVVHLLGNTHPLNQFVAAEALYYRDRLTHHKPDPKVFTVFFRETGLSPTECVYVGDSPTDCQAAKGAGLSFICCLESGLRNRADFETLQPPPDHYIDTFASLTQWLHPATA